MRISLANMDESPAAIQTPDDVRLCRHCGGGSLSKNQVEIAMRDDGRLFVVKDIPALVCNECGEEYINDAAAHSLQHLWEARDGVEAAETLVVPVYRYQPEPGI